MLLRSRGVDDVEVGAEGGAGASAEEPARALLAAAEAARAALAAGWSPLAPPAQEASGWLDAHLLYLLPSGSDTELAARLSAPSIEAAALGIRGRLLSPLFVASGEDPRRDPLGLRELLGARAAALGLRDEAAQDRDSADATPSGDLLAGDGESLVLEARGAGASVVASVEASIVDPRVSVAAAGPAIQRASAARITGEGLRGLPITALALLVVVLALGLRSVRAVLGLCACLLSGLAVGLAVGGPPDLLGLPLLILALGFGCEGMLHLQRIAAHGWAAPLILALALAPAAFAPYPAWQAWAWLWAAISAAIFASMRFALPAALTADDGWIRAGGAGLSLRPWPLVSVLLAGSLIAGGAAVFPGLRALPAAPLAIGDPALAEAEAELRASFFDPDGVWRARHVGASPAAALEAAAAASSALVGRYRRVDLPGAFVLTSSAIEARAAQLQALEVGSRIVALKESLRAAGLRPSAFGELLRGVAIEAPPAVEVALAGPLGPWFAARLGAEGDEARIRSRVFVDAGESADAADVAALGLRGPCAASERDRASFNDRLGLYAALNLWLGALIVWLATRSLASALAAALTSLACMCGVALILGALGRGIGPTLLPALLLVGAGGMIAGGRACRAMESREPLLVRGLLLTSTCQVAAGLALWTSASPLWREIGAVAAIGSTLAPLLAVLVTPGLHAALLRLLREVGPAR